MNDQTLLNPIIHRAGKDPTEQVTLINPIIAALSTELAIGLRLGDQYELIEPLEQVSGEADLYICSLGGNRYVAKVYRRQSATAPEVTERLDSIDSPLIASPIDRGYYRDLPYEILPYYPNGSLKGKTYSFEELKGRIVPAVNEALKCLHDRGILHNDLKPSNIMLGNDGASIALIDFGISFCTDSAIADGHIGLTPEYAAPERILNRPSAASDYYSFGITLYTLFCGYTPLTNRTDVDEMTPIDYPPTMPSELSALIDGLTAAKESERWGYDAVVSWCNTDAAIDAATDAATDEADLKLTSFHWKERHYETLDQLGAEMLGKLEANDRTDFDFWDDILRHKLLSRYESIDWQEKAAVIEQLEAVTDPDALTERERMMRYYRMAYLLSAQTDFCVADEKLTSVHQLTAYMKRLLDDSYEKFEDFCHSLIGYDDILDLRLEAWLIALGRQSELERWKMQMMQ